METAQQTSDALNVLETDSGFKKAMNDMESVSSSGKLVVPVGTLAGGKVLTADMADIPNLLVAGTTGSGKTTFVRTLVMSLLVRYSCDDVRLLVFDSKLVDYTFMNGGCHLLVPVLHDSSKAVGALSWALDEARKRLQADATGHVKRPDILIILDDYSSLALLPGCEETLTNLFLIGRAAGIHCIIVTSSPSSKILTADLKANISCRISFYAASRSVSRMVLDRNGAEELQFPGEMLFMQQNRLTKCMGILLPDSDIQKMTKIMQKPQPTVHPTDLTSLQQKAAEVFSGGDQPDVDDEQDALYHDAEKFVIDSGQGSTSMLQRRFRIGYARAGRLLDLLERKGVVGPPNGSGPRTVLMTYQQFLEENMVKTPETDFSSSEPEQDHTTAEKQPSTDKPAEQSPAVQPSEDIPLHPQPRLYSMGESIDVSDNMVHVHKVINSKFNPANGDKATTTSDYDFSGKRITRLLYSAPRLFSKGKITFVVAPTNWKVSDMRIGKTYSADMPETEISITFDKSNAPMFFKFISRIAEDVKIPDEQK